MNTVWTFISYLWGCNEQRESSHARSYFEYDHWKTFVK